VAPLPVAAAAKAAVAPLPVATAAALLKEAVEVTCESLSRRTQILHFQQIWWNWIANV
jgi:hypothetical protein